jgi:hypothetical protein
MLYFQIIILDIHIHTYLDLENGKKYNLTKFLKAHGKQIKGEYKLVSGGGKEKLVETLMHYETTARRFSMQVIKQCYRISTPHLTRWNRRYNSFVFLIIVQLLTSIS